MTIIHNMYHHSPSLSGRLTGPSLPRAKPGKPEGLLISPSGGRAGQISASFSWAYFWLGVGVILSAFNLVFALISLIIF